MSRSKSFPLGRAIFCETPLAGLFLCLACLVLALGASLATGAAALTLPTVLSALVIFDGSTAHQIVLTARVPRTLAALFVGASLAVAGALMQAISRNPLAAPSIMGVNAGAALAVVAATLLLDRSSLALYTVFSLIGAAIAGLTVYGLGSMGRYGMTPLKLIIAGSTVSTLLSSLTQGLLTVHESTLDEARFWLAGSLANRSLELLIQVLPYLVVGLVLALLLGKHVTTLTMGDDVAHGLGLNIGWVKGLATLCILLLAGASVAIAGPISFIGLVVPHTAQALVGSNYRWIIPYSAVLGSIFLLTADILARVIMPPSEVPVGVITALVGVPVLIWLVRQKVRQN